MNEVLDKVARYNEDVDRGSYFNVVLSFVFRFT